MAGNVTADLIRALIDTMGGPGADLRGWESLAIILEFPDGEFNQAHGYVYSANGAISAVASNPRAVRPAVKAYTDSYYQPGEAMPLKALVQFDRTTRNYDITFEETDEARWKVTPENVMELPAELRPSFD